VSVANTLCMAIELQLPQPTLSEETLLALSRDNPGYRFERSATGKLVVSPTGFFTSGGEGELFTQVSAWATQSALGRAFPPSAGLTLPDSSIVSPDTTFVRYERLESLSDADCTMAYVRLVPDVIFELASPSDDLRNLETKMYAYIANGVGVAVLIDPAARTVTTWRGVKRVTSSATSVRIEPQMPGFVFDAAAVIRAMERNSR